MGILYWPAGEPNTRIKSSGGLIRYTIVRVQSSPQSLYRWGREGGPGWSGIFYGLSDTKQAAEDDYFLCIQAVANKLRANGRPVYGDG